MPLLTPHPKSFENLMSPRRNDVCCGAETWCSKRGAKVKQGHCQMMNFRNHSTNVTKLIRGP